MLKNITTALFILYSLASYSQTVIINEVVAKNSYAYENQFGESPDWIELKNTSDKTVNLSEYSIALQSSMQEAFALENIEIEANGVALIECVSPRKFVGSWHTIIDKGDNWKYHIPTKELDSRWKQNNFDDSDWQEGNSGFGFGDNDDETILPQCVSVFLRKKFYIEDSAAIAAAILHIDYDDGFVAYINGIEISRAKLSGYPPAYNASASSHEANWYRGLPIESFRVEGLSGLLKTGENTLAIQVHNNSSSSTDLTAIPIFSISYTNTTDNFPTSAYIQLPQRALQIPSTISAKSDVIYLLHHNTIIDSIAINQLPSDVSVGRISANTSQNYYFNAPTPLLENTSTPYKAKTLAVPIVSEKEGVIITPIQLQFYADNNTSIRYTTDGSEPNELSPRADEGGINIQATTVLRYRAYKADHLPSAIGTSTYLMLSRPQTLPIVSIVFEPEDFFNNQTGIYQMGKNAEKASPHFGANFWQDWERKSHVEIFNTEGNIVLSEDLGVKIAGNWSRAHPQKSLKFYSRNEYGNKTIDYKIFRDKPIYSFESFILRNSGNDFNNTQMRDGAIHTLCRNMGLDYQAYEPAIVYMNGEYWGILNFREKINKHYIVNNHAIPYESFTIINNPYDVPYGDASLYKELQEYFEQHDLTNAAHYERVKQELDIDNFIKYFLIEMYAVNEDWPGNNIKAWRENGEHGKWRYILYDLDFGFGIWDDNKVYKNMLTYSLVNNPNIDYPNPPWSTLMLRKLVANSDFKSLMLNHLADRLNTTLSPDSIAHHIDSIYSLIRSELPYHATRWNGYISYMESNVQAMKNFGNNRGNIMRGHFEQYFNTNGSYDLNLSISDNSAGRIHLNTIDITKFPWSGKYFKNNTITLTAIPAPGYTFNRWEGDVHSTETTISITTANAKSVHAVFDYNQDNKPKVYVSEICYNGGSLLSSDWIELHNALPKSQAIGGWTLRNESGKILYAFPEHYTMQALEYIVICESTENFEHDYNPISYRIVGNLSQELSNSQGEIRLYDAYSNYIHSMSYTDSYPYPKKSDGYGYSLEYVGTNTYDNNVQNWRSPAFKGTPGYTNTQKPSHTLAAGSVVINELMYSSHDNNKAGDWIELYNTTQESIDISGWVIRDAQNSIFIFPEHTTIAANSYIVVSSNPELFSRVYPSVDFLPMNIGFKSSGDFIRLLDAFEYVVDSLEYTVFSDLGLYTNGTGLPIIRDNDNPQHWTYGIWGGTPGQANTEEFTTIEELVQQMPYVAPNPCTTAVTIHAPNAIKITIYSMQGIKIAEEYVQDGSIINVQTLKPANYIIRITTDSEEIYAPLIKSE